MVGARTLFAKNKSEKWITQSFDVGIELEAPGTLDNVGKTDAGKGSLFQTFSHDYEGGISIQLHSVSFPTEEGPKYSDDLLIASILEKAKCHPLDKSQQGEFTVLSGRCDWEGDQMIWMKYGRQKDTQVVVLFYVKYKDRQVFEASAQRFLKSVKWKK